MDTRIMDKPAKLFGKAAEWEEWSECDAECESEVCHWDNWRCFATDEFELYDQVGNGSCQTRRKLRNSLVWEIENASLRGVCLARMRLRA